MSIKVAPHAGAWIEIRRFSSRSASRTVAPHAGAWIEIGNDEFQGSARSVAPHAGAWIEIRWEEIMNIMPYRSRPTRARGLKWRADQRTDEEARRRAPRGRVD